MTHPSDDLRDIQKWWRSLKSKTTVVDDHSSIRIYKDTIGEQNCNRWSYIMEQDGAVIAIATLVNWTEHDDAPCLDLGYAVDGAHRENGYGKQIAEIAINDILRHLGCDRWFVEASVDSDNAISHVIAEKLLKTYIGRRTDPDTQRVSLIFRREYSA